MKEGKNSIFMKKTKNIRFRLHGFFCFIAILLSGTAPVYSQYAYVNIDTTAFSADSNAVKECVLEAANVEFPDILKGNEEATIDYIEKFSVRRRDYLIRMYTKGSKLLPKAAGILKKHNLPEELKVLMILESAYNANAVSRCGAVGYWQFMDAAAKQYGLKYISREEKVETVVVKKVIKKRGRKIVIEKKTKVKKDITKRKGKCIDERTNFNKSTLAAARYLRDRRLNLDDNWLLVVASYNWGIGNVWNAMERCGKENPTFWDIKKYLPEETKAYVMNFITLNVIYKNYDKFLKNNLVFKPVKQTLPADSFEDNIVEEVESSNTASLK